MVKQHLSLWSDTCITNNAHAESGAKIHVPDVHSFLDIVK
jgi:hypothetical protein